MSHHHSSNFMVGVEAVLEYQAQQHSSSDALTFQHYLCAEGTCVLWGCSWCGNFFDKIHTYIMYQTAHVCLGSAAWDCSNTRMSDGRRGILGDHWCHPSLEEGRRKSSYSCLWQKSNTHWFNTTRSVCVRDSQLIAHVKQLLTMEQHKVIMQQSFEVKRKYLEKTKKISYKGTPFPRRKVNFKEKEHTQDRKSQCDMRSITSVNIIFIAISTKGE